MFIRKFLGAGVIIGLVWMVFDSSPLPTAYINSENNKCVAFVNPPDEAGIHSDMGCEQRHGRRYVEVTIGPEEVERVLEIYAN